MSDKSPKSRGNWAPQWCPRTGCANRGKRCGDCVKESELALSEDTKRRLREAVKKGGES